MEWFAAMLLEMNVFGMGATPILIGMALMIAIVVNVRTIRQKDYENAAMTFLIAYVSTSVSGIPIDIPLTILVSVLAGMGWFMTMSSD